MNMAMLHGARRGRSVLTTWLVSSFSLILLSVIVSLIVYIPAYRVVQEQIDRANGEVLKQAKMAMDNRLQDVRSLGVSILFNPTLNMLIQDASAEEIYGHYYLVRQTINEIRNHNLTKWYVDDISVFLNKSDSILTTNGLAGFDAFYAGGNQRGTVFRNYISLADWRTLLRGDYEGEYVLLPGFGSDAAASKPVLYLRSLPLFRDDRTFATLVVSLNKSRFYDVLQGIGSLNDAWGVLLDSSDNVLYSMNPLDDTLPVKYAQLREETGSLSVRVRGRACTVSYITSGIGGWKYLTLMPSRVYDEKLARTRLLMALSILGIILCGGAGAYLVSTRNYRPVGELVRSIGRRVPLRADPRFDEYRYIQEAMESTLGENERMNQMLKEQTVALRASLLVKLLKGRISDAAYARQALERHGISMPEERFAVLLFSVLPVEGPSDGQGKEPAEDALARVGGAVARAVERGASRGCRGHVVEVDGMLGCILALDGTDPAAGRPPVLAIAGEAAEAVHASLGVDLMAAASGIHETLFGIATAYDEALSVMEYKRTLDIDDMVSYDQIKTPHNNYDYPMETEHRLISAIKAGDTDTAKALVDGVFERNCAMGSLSNDMVKCLMFDLASTVLKTLSELGALGDALFVEKLDIVKKLIGHETVGEMKQLFAGILEETCASIRQNRTTRTDHVIRAVTTYVEGSFHDPNLSVSAIAESCRLTPTYLIRLFKEQTGEGVFQFITRKRMESAKTLLREGCTINEAAARVGYFSPTAFMRAFKKSEGMTPGAFKEAR
jgi:AraC-like DNA-binding protein